VKIFNPIVGMGIPLHIRFLLFFIPIKWSADIPIEGFHATWSIGYKRLFGVIYIVNEKS